MSKITLPLSVISTEGLQVRVETNRAHVDDLVEVIGDSGQWPDAIPPIVVFGREPGPYFLADGHHRLQAAQEAGCTEVPVVLHPGDKQDALWYAVGANATHGLRRTADDRRNAILTAHRLDSGMSQRRIAELCKVSQERVSYYLNEHKSRCLDQTPDIAKQSPSGQVIGPITCGPEPTCANSAPAEPEPKPGVDAEPAHVIGMDGKHYPRRKAATPTTDKPADGSAAAAPETAPPWAATAEQIDGIVRALRDVQQQLNALAGEPGAELLRAHALRCEKHGDVERWRSADVQNALSELAHWRPFIECPSCKEKVDHGCQLCKGLKWLTEASYNRCPERLRG